MRSLRYITFSDVKSKFCSLQISNLGFKGGDQKLKLESQMYESQIGGGEGGGTPDFGTNTQNMHFFIDGFP